MKNLKRNSFLSKLSVFLLGLFVFISSLNISILTAQVTPTTNISHSLVQFFIPGHRIQVKALITDEVGVMLVRCYFKSKGEENFVFVDMPLEAGNEYAGIIPAPSEELEKIEYLFLVVNNNKIVFRTNVFEAVRKEDEIPPDWQKVDSGGHVSVKTELAQAAPTIPGFTDSIVTDGVESGFRFGYVVEGIYTPNQMAGEAPAGAVNGGTVDVSITMIATTILREEKKEKKRSPLLTPALIAGGAAVAGGAYLAGTIIFGKFDIRGDWKFDFTYPNSSGIFSIKFEGDNKESGTASGSGYESTQTGSPNYGNIISGTYLVRENNIRIYLNLDTGITLSLLAHPEGDKNINGSVSSSVSADERGNLTASRQ